MYEHISLFYFLINAVGFIQKGMSPRNEREISGDRRKKERKN
jgi:hypothetical protein